LRGERWLNRSENVHYYRLELQGLYRDIFTWRPHRYLIFQPMIGEWTMPKLVPTVYTGAAQHLAPMLRPFLPACTVLSVLIVWPMFRDFLHLPSVSGYFLVVCHTLTQ
jgi:hypothetical protein